MSWINGILGWKCCGAHFSSLCHSWTRWLTKGDLKQELSGIQITTFLRVNNFRNILKLWSWSFFSICPKFYVDCKNVKKIGENKGGFWDNGVQTCCENFSQFAPENMSSAVKVLPNSPRISNLTKRDLFWLTLSWHNE